MQQDKNNIQNKLRQLENQQLPDLSNMDKHWQEMQLALTGSNAAINTGAKSFFRLHLKKFLLAASVITILLVAVLYKNTQPVVKNSADNSLVTSPSQKVQEEQPLHDTTLNTNKVEVKKTDLASSKKMFFDPTKKITIPVKLLHSDSTLKKTELNDIDINRQFASTDIIPAFYNTIQKPVQQFRINADEGGSFTCKEGTVIIIPPAAFTDANNKIVSGDVIIRIEEFYKYADIIAANLTTMSDNRQLVTGGMIRISASKDGNNIDLIPQKAIAVTMPAREYDPAMKLFTQKNEVNVKANNADTVSTGYSYETSPGNTVYINRRNINWEETGYQYGLPVFDGKTNFLNLADNPAKVRGIFRNVAVFRLPENSPYTIEGAKKILTDKYGDHYDKIKVKRNRVKKFSFFGIRTPAIIENTVGDSVKLTLKEALRYHYIESKDSAFYAEKTKADSIKFMNMYGGGLVKIVEQNRINKSYSFSIKKMGWINCDRFYKCENKIDLAINLPPDVKANRFVSQVVFKSIRSVMPGKTSNNKIGFLDIPSGMEVYVVGLGEKNGKVVSFLKKLRTSSEEVNITDLEETTPEAFRKKLDELDMN